MSGSINERRRFIIAAGHVYPHPFCFEQQLQDSRLRTLCGSRDYIDVGPPIDELTHNVAVASQSREMQSGTNISMACFNLRPSSDQNLDNTGMVVVCSDMKLDKLVDTALTHRKGTYCSRASFIDPRQRRFSIPAEQG